MLDKFIITPIATINQQDIPTSKGLYCFLISKEGINKINEIHPHINLKVTDFTRIESSNVTLFLLYVGQAGVRNTGKNTNSGHLRQRYNWHVLQKHSCAVIRNKTLSSFRATVGSILTDDLLSSEDFINCFLRNYLHFGYYSADDQLINQISELELSIIKDNKPVFNKKHNDNARKGREHPAARVASLRQVAYKLTLQMCQRSD